MGSKRQRPQGPVVDQLGDATREARDGLLMRDLGVTREGVYDMPTTEGQHG
jgi:hypothetical protein